MSLDFPLLSHLKRVYGGGGKWVVKAVEGHLSCFQEKDSKVEERLVHLRMEVKFEVLIERKKMYYLGLRRFDLWMEFFDVQFGGVRDEEVVVGEGVVVTSSSLEMLTNSCLGGIMVNLIFLEGFEEEALVEFMVE
ncbi:hypothetical protein Tco_0839247 [Tanacetum coccineum]|uniref:Uncharacterized protein n=1 Tax=Tanacetum coccineum TaxID=301880 RepID=A0ABQ5AQS2_9ASTR